MLNLNQSTFNFSGTSEVDGASIAAFAAGYSGNDVYLSISITDINAYNSNKQTFDADFGDFKDTVMATIANIVE